MAEKILETVRYMLARETSGQSSSTTTQPNESDPMTLAEYKPKDYPEYAPYLKAIHTLKASHIQKLELDDVMREANRVKEQQNFECHELILTIAKQQHKSWIESKTGSEERIGRVIGLIDKALEATGPKVRARGYAINDPAQQQDPMFCLQRNLEKLRSEGQEALDESNEDTEMYSDYDFEFSKSL